MCLKQFSFKEIAKLCDGECKALVIKMLTDLIELSQKMKKTNERYPEWNKAKYSGNQQWWEGNKDSKQQFGTKGKNKYPTITAWRNTNSKKWRESYKRWDNLKRSNIQIIGVPEGEQQQEIENLFERITKENFPNLVKEIDFQEVQEAQRVPKKLDPKKNTPKHIIIKLPKIKDRES